MSYDPADTDLVIFLARAGGCSLATSPGNKDNWIERAGPGGKGGKLPNYICKIAKGVMKSGKSKSQALSIAVSRVKAWAAGGDDVNADTRAKAAKAVAQWEALKAKNKAKRLVKATHSDGTPYLALAQEGLTAFDVDRVRNAWNELMRKARERHYAKHHGVQTDEGTLAMPSAPYLYIKSLWTTFIIVESESDISTLLKIPYTVTDDDVVFGQPEAVKVNYEPVTEWEEAWDEALFEDDDDEDGDELTANEILLLADLLAGGA